jgi:hypothetical protein
VASPELNLRPFFVCASIVCVLALASCGLLSPEQQHTALQVLDGMRAQGTITQAQYDALVESLLSGSTTAWWMQLVQVIGSAALAYAGVQWRRGPVATPSERAARIAPPSTAE